MNSPQDQISHYLATGESDTLSYAWPGDCIIARAQCGSGALRNALIKEVIGRTPHASTPEQVAHLDVAAFAREKITPMVRGLFPVNERPVLMDMFSRSVVFLSSDNAVSVISETRFLSTAWDLANLYLLSCGAETLSEQAPKLVGLSEGTTCYVSTEYFRCNDRLEDFVVHEAAHVFHNCKRETIGLPRIRGRDWLLEIDFHKRELFAYVCEVYSRLLALGSTRASRRRCLAELESGPPPPDDRVDPNEYWLTLREAVESNNGWKKIHDRCRPPRKP
ncbi:hypothetical protein [Acidisphaera sp. L21]|uniref:hypothetical protein n=1 Tax=Acidisphaera sp. L21 TaxID=1641851 RepID=UPI00131B2D32|nr:hypothetical protein [Acidisphaera sp. L21]